MIKRRVLIIGDEGIALFLTNGKKVEHECSLPWTLPNFDDDLVSVLKNKNSAIPVFILYDALEQQYRKENIIKTNILDQNKLVKRKLGSLFPNVLSYSYIELKDKKKKKSNKGKESSSTDNKKYLSYLIAAVPNTEQMDRIEYAITEANCNISGFALLPVESSRFAKEFTKKITPKNSPTPKWTLLMTHHETGGLRQIFIKEDTLILTRLTPMTIEDGAGGTKWSEEVYKGFTTTLNYISRFGFSPEDGLDVIVICNDENKSLLKTYDFKNANLHCYSIKDAEKLFNFTIQQKQNPKSQFAEMLHAGWIARQHKLIMPFKINWIQNIAIPKKTAKVVAFLLFLAMCGTAFMSLESWQEYQEVKEEISYKESNRTVLEKEYEQEEKIFDTLPIRPSAIKATLQTKEELNKYSMVSYHILDKVKRALGKDTKLISMKYVDNRSPEEKIKKKKVYVYVPPSKVKKNVNYLNIRIKFAFEKELTVEEKVKEVEIIKDRFVKIFPKHRVKLEQQHSNSDKKEKASSGKFSDIINDDKQKKVNPANNYAEISISGEHL